MGDCDDTEPDVHPDAEELCGDVIDHDCDGVVNEDCPCPCFTLESLLDHQVPGGTHSCHELDYYEGPYGPMSGFDSTASAGDYYQRMELFHYHDSDYHQCRHWWDNPDEDLTIIDYSPHSHLEYEECYATLDLYFAYLGVTCYVN